MTQLSYTVPALGSTGWGTALNEILTEIKNNFNDLEGSTGKKADIDLLNLSNGLANTICTTAATTTSTASSARPAVVVENYKNGTSWYRVWSDGWCEQGGSTGLLGGNSYTRNTVTFLKTFKDTNYTITNAPNKYSTQNGLNVAYPPFIYTKNTGSCVFGGFCWTDGFDWVACGYIS